MCFKYQNALNACAEACGADKFDYDTPQGYPWSSSLYNEYDAWCVGTGAYGSVNGDGRLGNCCVRAAF